MFFKSENFCNTARNMNRSNKLSFRRLYMNIWPMNYWPDEPLLLQAALYLAYYKGRLLRHYRQQQSFYPHQTRQVLWLILQYFKKVENSKKKTYRLIVVILQVSSEVYTWFLWMIGSVELFFKSKIQFNCIWNCICQFLLKMFCLFSWESSFKNITFYIQSNEKLFGWNPVHTSHLL